MFIADVTKTIKSTENHPIEDGMIEKLDEMLTQYGVQHFFSLPIDSTDGIANNDEDCLNIFYASEDSMTFNLVYMLWVKTTRHCTDEMIVNAMRKLTKEEEV